MTFEQLQSANSTIKTTPIKGKNYAEVNQRIKAFRNLCPNGCIDTILMSCENGVCIIQAKVYDEEHNLLGSGTAYEKEDANFINQTSFIENCETSAVGRALGMCGLGIDTSVCSAEELTNAINNQEPKNEPKADGSFTPKCAKCGAEISVKVHDFSVKKFKKPLCMECQKNG